MSRYSMLYTRNPFLLSSAQKYLLNSLFPRSSPPPWTLIITGSICVSFPFGRYLSRRCALRDLLQKSPLAESGIFSPSPHRIFQNHFFVLKTVFPLCYSFLSFGNLFFHSIFLYVSASITRYDGFFIENFALFQR